MTNRSAGLLLSAAAGTTTMTAASAPSPLYPIYQRLWGFSAFTLTVVFALYVFALLLALLTVGSLSDRIGRRPVASVALVLLALGMLLFATAHGVGALMLARIVQGFAVGASTGTTTAMILETAPTERAGSAVSSAVPSLGIVIGAVLAGFLVQFAPLPRQLVFWVLTAAAMLLAVLVWLIPGERPSGPVTHNSLWWELRPRAGLPAEARPTFLTLLPSMAATWALAGLYLSLGSSVLSTVLGVQDHFVSGLVVGTLFAAGTVGALVSTFLPVEQRTFLGLAALASGVVITLVAMLLVSQASYVVGSAVAGLGFGASFQLAVTSLGAVAPAARRGEIFATMYIASYLAFSVPALAAGLAVEGIGLKPTAISYGLLEVLLIMVAIASQARRNRISEKVFR